MVRGRRKTRIGRVVSDKMDKTVVVVVEWRLTHPLYNKSVKRITKFHAHNEDNVAKVGDTVNITETRALSKTKRWRVTQVVASGDIAVSDELQELPQLEMEEADEGDGGDEAESEDQGEDEGEQEKEE
jgi:small subunit ribosomal protein S17